MNFKNRFKPNADFKYFLNFIIERQRIFDKKTSGKLFPWTEDETFRNHKFTNVYRFLDYESQFLINDVIKKHQDLGMQDTAFRILLFKTFNRSETWKYLESKLGTILSDVSITDMVLVLDDYVKEGGKVFSSAYLQAANFVQQGKYGYLKGKPKYQQYLSIFMSELLTPKNLKYLHDSKDLKTLCLRLQETPGIGGFMSYQFAQDLNYSKYFHQNMASYVEEGPGSIRGINRVFDLKYLRKPNYKEILMWTHQHIDELFEEYGLGGEFKPFRGVPLGLTDIQNCFCETDKYMREVYPVKGKRIKQKYRPENKRSVDYTLPFFD